MPKSSLSAVRVEGAAVIVCHCGVVRCSEIRTAVDNGAASVSAVCAATGAAQECGGCVFAVKRVMCEHVDSRRLVEVEGAAS